MRNKEIIEAFYEAFARGDAEGMVRYYADDIVFEDPAFGRLEGPQAADMWRMLVSQESALAYSKVWSRGDTGGAQWEARYFFGKSGRKVHNRVVATFEFRSGKIIRHRDQFSFRHWSRQALGLTGLLLGWTPFLQRKVRKQALAKLALFTSRKGR